MYTRYFNATENSLGFHIKIERNNGKKLVVEILEENEIEEDEGVGSVWVGSSSLDGGMRGSTIMGWQGLCWIGEKH